MPDNTQEILRSNLPKDPRPLTPSRVTFTRSDLAQYLGIHRRTVAAYHDFAYWEIEDYRKYCRQKERIRLNKYQAWVLYVLTYLFQQLDYGNKQDAVRAALRDNPDWINEARYRQEGWELELIDKKSVIDTLAVEIKSYE
ncbi:hypothetical protein [Leptolyngbya sp. AN03gr2]|uniref:hypothetical protein n=1 Tax=Leptolyngbya sp. AN03gr2 TaxID=3423364 RepID=UPI003D31EC28